MRVVPPFYRAALHKEDKSSVPLGMLKPKYCMFYHWFCPRYLKLNGSILQSHWLLYRVKKFVVKAVCDLFQYGNHYKRIWASNTNFKTRYSNLSWRMLIGTLLADGRRKILSQQGWKNHLKKSFSIQPYLHEFRIILKWYKRF